MGLLVSVYRNAELPCDCTNNGVSSRTNKLCVVNIDGPSDPTDDAPAVLLLEGNLPETVHIKPEGLVDSGMVVMMGGNYAGTSDSRFGNAIAKITGQRFAMGMAPIHDRVEG